jgi:hypothetical protein
MRAAPAFQISLRRSGVWRAATLCVVALGLGALAGWLVTHERPVDPMLLVGAAALGCAVVALGAQAARVPAVDLRFDGRGWYLIESAASSNRTGIEAVAGDLHVAIDLGAWMLLRFVPVPTSSDMRQRAIWLPVQRWGAENQWHAFRVSVYAPRPAPTEDPPVPF